MKKILMVVALLFGLLTVSPASADDTLPEDPRLLPSGCASGSGWYKKFDVWSGTGGYQNRFGEAFVIRLTATTFYYVCQRPNSPYMDSRQVKPKKIEFCYSHIDSDDGGLGFNGVEFNTFYVSNLNNIDPPTITVADDGTRQNCKMHDIGAANERWMDPLCTADLPCARWKTTAWVRTDGMPGKEFIFVAVNGRGDLREHKFFEPGDDLGW